MYGTKRDEASPLDDGDDRRDEDGDKQNTDDRVVKLCEELYPQGRSSRGSQLVPAVLFPHGQNRFRREPMGVGRFWEVPERDHFSRYSA